MVQSKCPKCCLLQYCAPRASGHIWTATTFSYLYTYMRLCVHIISSGVCHYIHLTLLTISLYITFFRTFLHCRFFLTQRCWAVTWFFSGQTVWIVYVPSYFPTCSWPQSRQCCHIKIGWTRSTSPGSGHRWTRVPTRSLDVYAGLGSLLGGHAWACVFASSPPRSGCTTRPASGDLLTGAVPDRRQTSSLGSHDLSSTKASLNY